VPPWIAEYPPALRWRVTEKMEGEGISREAQDAGPIRPLPRRKDWSGNSHEVIGPDGKNFTPCGGDKIVEGRTEPTPSSSRVRTALRQITAATPTADDGPRLSSARGAPPELGCARRLRRLAYAPSIPPGACRAAFLPRPSAQAAACGWRIDLLEITRPLRTSLSYLQAGRPRVATIPGRASRSEFPRKSTAGEHSLGYPSRPRRSMGQACGSWRRRTRTLPDLDLRRRRLRCIMERT